MIGAETGIAALAMFLAQGLLGIVKYTIGKYSDKDTNLKAQDVERIVKYALAHVQLNEQQAGQLKNLYEMHQKFDNDGTPIWYVPRSWAETNKDIVDKLYRVSETQNKTLAIIERLERRVELLDKP